MVIRRSDQRRRRVVIDEVANARSANGGSKRAKSAAAKPTTRKRHSASDDGLGDNACGSRLYSFGADRRGQRKTTDFLPKRLLSFSLVVLVLISTVAVINVLAFYAPSWETVIGTQGRQALSIYGVGTLASWFSSFLFIVTGLASLQVYALRQHRCDDYQGTYRLWLWMAGLFLLASVHCIVDLGGIARSVFDSFSQQSGGQKVWALVTFKIVALTLLIIRGLFEVKESKGALGLVILVWIAFTCAAVMQIPAVSDSLTVDFDAVYGNVLLVAGVLVLLSQLTYARFVFLHANGLIKLTPKAVKAEAEETAEPVVEKKTRKKKSTRKSKAEPAVEFEDVEESDPEIETVKAKPRKTAKRKSRIVNSPVLAEQSEPAATVAAAKPAKSVRPPVPKPASKVPPVPVPEPTSRSKNTKRAQEDDDEREILSMSPDQIAKLSKSERRRQRKLEKRMKRAA